LWLAKLMVEGFNLFTWPSDGNLFFPKWESRMNSAGKWESFINSAVHYKLASDGNLVVVMWVCIRS
jgi:hypothetical protein